MDEAEAILKAFNNPKYNWRTVTGIAREANVDSKRVTDYINMNSDILIKSSVKSTKGHELFAMRDIRRTKASTMDRLYSAVKNRGA